ncbi:MAG: T9SS type A sorting domain-containing protein [Bacteroidota bacterium]|jgi:hypothetical protein
MELLLFRRFVLIIFLLLAILTVSFSTQYYISTTGSDTNPGTIDLPFLTLTKAVGLSSLIPGDTIYIRGGTYTLSSTVSISKIGTKDNLYDLFAYPGEQPVFNFSTQTSSDGIKVNGKYWHLRGIESCYAAHNGIAVNGSYNIIENCSVHDNRNSGMQLGNGASYNRVINCDSYFNFDAPAGGNADGFSPKLDVGTGNYFYGCRSWQNSDDGWDGYVRPAPPVIGKDTMKTIIENCWSFMNGYLKDGNPISTGNGNGFKMGGGDPVNNISNGDSLRHNMILTNCLCFDNRVKGYDQNNNRGSMTLINCTGFRNGSYNFSVPGFIRKGETLTVENCISLLSSGVTLSGVPNPILATNSWLAPFSGATSADFISIDTMGVRGPRKPDGSLPDITFMHLASSSPFVNRGTDVGLPYIGTAPDLGCFETSVLTGIADQMNSSVPQIFNLFQNYPNPFNPSTEMRYSISATSIVKLSIFDILGQEVAILVNDQMQPGNYVVRWNASQLSSGFYVARLSARTGTGQAFLQTRKMLLTK